MLGLFSRSAGKDARGSAPEHGSKAHRPARCSPSGKDAGKTHRIGPPTPTTIHGDPHPRLQTDPERRAGPRLLPQGIPRPRSGGPRRRQREVLRADGPRRPRGPAARDHPRAGLVRRRRPPQPGRGRPPCAPCSAATSASPCRSCTTTAPRRPTRHPRAGTATAAPSTPPTSSTPCRCSTTRRTSPGSWDRPKSCPGRTSSTPPASSCSTTAASAAPFRPRPLPAASS